MAKRRGDDFVDTVLDMVLVGGIVFVGYSVYRSVKNCEVPDWLRQSFPDLFKHCPALPPGGGGGSGSGGGGTVTVPPGGTTSPPAPAPYASVWDVRASPVGTFMGLTPLVTSGTPVEFAVQFRYAGPQASLRILVYLEPTVPQLGWPPYAGTGEIVSPRAVDWPVGPCTSSGCQVSWRVTLTPEAPGTLYLIHAIVTSSDLGIRQEYVAPGVNTVNPW